MPQDLSARLAQIILGEDELKEDEGVHPSILEGAGINPGDGQSNQKELALRACFSEVLKEEVETLSSKGVQVDKERKKQILGDILVWAEITQEHYDEEMQRFVLQPNQNDESFKRIGHLFREAKVRHAISK